jgi:hypothetical protein
MNNESYCKESQEKNYIDKIYFLFKMKQNKINLMFSIYEFYNISR